MARRQRCTADTLAGGLQRVDAIERYVDAMERRGLAKLSIEKWRDGLRRVDRELGLWTANPETLERWVWAGPRQADRTRYQYLSMLDCFYAWCIKHGYHDENPASRIARPRLRRTLPRPASEPDVEVAIAMAPAQMRAWLTLAAYAGLRCCEIAWLERHWLQDTSEPPMLRVLGKGDKERLVPMHPRVWEAVRACGLPRKGRVFTTPTGCGYSPPRVSKMISKYLTDIGLDISAHQFRHRFATRCYQSCQDLRAVQELLGHESPTTTSIYAAFAPTVGLDAVMSL